MSPDNPASTAAGETRTFRVKIGEILDLDSFQKLHDGNPIRIDVYDEEPFDKREAMLWLEWPHGPNPEDGFPGGTWSNDWYEVKAKM